MRINFVKPTFRTLWLLGAALLVIGILIALKINSNKLNTLNQSPTATPADEVRVRADDSRYLRVSLSTNKTRVVIGDKIILTSQIKNTGPNTYRRTFSATCTQPSVYINNEDVSPLLVCGQALTTIEIKSQETKTYTDEYTVSSKTRSYGNAHTLFFQPGQNNLQTGWGEMSNIVSIERL